MVIGSIGYIHTIEYYLAMNMYEWQLTYSGAEFQMWSLQLLCPGCGNALVVEEGQGCLRLACNTCPYVRITSKETNRKYLKLKEVDDVLGGEAAWETADSAEICSTLEHPCAYFMPLQTCSAHEPLTTFCKCRNARCGHRQRDYGYAGSAASAFVYLIPQSGFPAGSHHCVS
ncbi:DNA-directed RNA polymerase III subunit RPC10-like [Desmodus rotundus]|uniref:DNA-directed RNA polymerase III subunit RPC10-like n=1 Tax=Desmodus rotundus TaxID=9430 RepID=UPI00238152D8|nr:DNA-directed RNA polymerase III subunit RPC10-like [Desmodus rotundus]